MNFTADAQPMTQDSPAVAALLGGVNAGLAWVFGASSVMQFVIAGAAPAAIALGLDIAEHYLDKSKDVLNKWYDPVLWAAMAVAGISLALGTSGQPIGAIVTSAFYRTYAPMIAVGAVGAVVTLEAAPYVLNKIWSILAGS